LETAGRGAGGGGGAYIVAISERTINGKIKSREDRRELSWSIRADLPVETARTAAGLRDLLLAYHKNRSESRKAPTAMPAIPPFGKLELVKPAVGKFKLDPEPVPSGVNVVDDVPSNTTESIHNI
jgi:hypothetical protein